MVVRRQPHGGRALAARDREVHQGARLQDRHAGGLLGRGERPGVGAGPVHREQPGAQPEPQGPRHRARRSRAASIRSCLSPTSSRPASTSRCCAACTSTSGWPASRPCRRSRASTAPTPARTRPTSGLHERAPTRSWRRSRPITRPRSCRRRPTRTSSSTCGRSSTPPATTTTSRSTAWSRVEARPARQAGRPGRRPSSPSRTG